MYLNTVFKYNVFKYCPALSVYYADLVAIHSNLGHRAIIFKSKFNPLRPSAPHMRRSAKI